MIGWTLSILYFQLVGFAIFYRRKVKLVEIAKKLQERTLKWCGHEYYCGEESRKLCRKESYLPGSPYQVIGEGVDRKKRGNTEGKRMCVKME